jgi:SpoVK/Ycf46/Vps4 family AAA+-type ATPase
VIFFDEIDALCPRRTAHDTGSTARVVNQLLTEMDGVDPTTASKRVYVMAATNRMGSLKERFLLIKNESFVLYRYSRSGYSSSGSS